MAETRTGGHAHVPAEHTKALDGHGKTCRWMSAATGALGNRVMAVASNNQSQ